MRYCSPDLRVDLADGRAEIVGGCIPVGHPVGVGPRREHLLGRGGDVLLDADRRLGRARQVRDVEMHQARLLVAAIPLVLDRAEDDGVEPGIGGRLPRRRHPVGPGEFAREHLVEDDARGVDVGAVVDGLGHRDLFGSHVAERADHPVVIRAARRRRGAEERGQAEIHEPHPSRASPPARSRA